MSRKRACARSCSQTALVDPSLPCNGVEDYAYEYYRPGCYCTPQVVRQATPYTLGTCFHQCPEQWNACSEATYVVNAFGIVYYLSDFENLLQLPNSLALETETDTEITYHYEYEKDGSEDMDDEEDAAVSPRKRERFECEDELESQREPSESKQPLSEPDLAKPGNVYRSEEGYLVEEPSEESAVPSTPK